MLWPYLVESIVPVQYTGAVGIVSRCIADIGKKKREEEAEDYELNFDELSMWRKYICAVQCILYMYLFSYFSELTQTT